MKAPLLALFLALLAVLILCTPPAQAAGTGPEPVGITVLLAPDASLPASVASDAQIARTAQALADWANHDLAPAWRLPAVQVLAVPRGHRLPPAHAWQWVLHLMPSTDVAMALGYHTTSPHGVPYGELGVEDAIAEDGNWSQVASHELAELLVNPFGNRIAYAAWHQGAMTGWIVEVCDPVAEQWYGWGDRGSYYRMADFVYPAEFDPGARYPLDKLHLLKAPFSATAGGYTTLFSLSMQPRPPFVDRHD